MHVEHSGWSDFGRMKNAGVAVDAAIDNLRDSVIGPGPDGFATKFEADRSMLGGPMDHVQPELGDE